MNPAELKLELATHGVWPASGRGDLVRASSVTDGIELLLPGDLWASVPLCPQESDSPYTLLVEGDTHTLAWRGGERVEVRLVPPPEFYRRTTSAGTPMWRIARVFGGSLVISPSTPCSLALWGAPCSFCATGTPPTADQPPAIAVAEVVEVVRAAFAEGAAEFVYFNAGNGSEEDGGIVFLEPYVRAVKRHFDTLVAVQLHPPRSDGWIDQTYALGVDALSYSVEIHDAAALERYCGERVRRIGRERYYEALRRAAAIFPSGTVWSDLILGLEAPASTRAGIDELTSIGVLPVLSLPRSSNGAPATPVTDRAALLAHLFNAVRDARINMGWVRDLSFAITPLEARFFASDDARMSVMQSFYRTRVGSLTARNLSRLRRRLRVRRVGDSFDSSHL